MVINYCYSKYTHVRNTLEWLPLALNDYYCLEQTYSVLNTTTPIMTFYLFHDFLLFRVPNEIERPFPLTKYSKGLILY